MQQKTTGCPLTRVIVNVQFVGFISLPVILLTAYEWYQAQLRLMNLYRYIIFPPYLLSFSMYVKFL